MIPSDNVKDSHVSRLRRPDGHSYRPSNRRQTGADVQDVRAPQSPTEYACSGFRGDSLLSHTETVEMAKMNKMIRDLGQKANSLGPGLHRRLTAIEPPTNTSAYTTTISAYVTSLKKKKKALKQYEKARTEPWAHVKVAKMEELVRIVQQNVLLKQELYYSRKLASGLCPLPEETPKHVQPPKHVQLPKHVQPSSLGENKEADRPLGQIMKRKWKPVLIAVRHTKKSAQMQAKADKIRDRDLHMSQKSEVALYNIPTGNKADTIVVAGYKATLTHSTQSVKSDVNFEIAEDNGSSISTGKAASIESTRSSSSSSTFQSAQSDTFFASNESSPESIRSMASLVNSAKFITSMVRNAVSVESVSSSASSHVC